MNRKSAVEERIHRYNVIVRLGDGTYIPTSYIGKEAFEVNRESLHAEVIQAGIDYEEAREFCKKHNNHA